VYHRQNEEVGAPYAADPPAAVGAMVETLLKMLRIVAGFVVSVVVLYLLDQLPLRFDANRFTIVELYFWLGVTGGICLFFSALAGSVVAGGRFAAAAMLLALLVWTLAANFLKTEALGYSSADTLPYAFANVSGLLLTLGGAVAGARLGARLVERFRFGHADAH